MIHIMLHMAETRSTVRRWGNSMAAVIPPEAIRAEGLREGDAVILEVRKARRLEDLFGLLKDRRLDAQAIKDSIRAEDSE
jgi:antitoxin component of MazEF toxin-antitoxin module